jgi:hypothetical protein
MQTFKRCNMKTIILSLLFTGSSFALFAQETTDSTKKDTTGGNTDTVNTIRSTGSYGAYGSVAVPPTVQSTFMSQYPNAGNAMWDKDTATNMWRARYNTGGRNISVYMDERGNTYSLALPLVQSLVSENVISSAVNKFGNNVYDILQLKTGDSQYVYQVRLIENGQVRAVHMNEDGSEAVYTPVVHTDATDSAGNMNNSNPAITDTTGSWNKGDNNMNNNKGTNNLNNQNQSTETPNNTDADQETDNTNNNTNNNTNTNSTEGMNNSGNKEMESTDNKNNNTDTENNSNTETNP